MSKLSALLKSHNRAAISANPANPYDSVTQNRNFARVDVAAKAGQSIDLSERIRMMAKRWGYTELELAEALAGAESDPRGWFIWTERDERDFGGCISPSDFAARYKRLRGLT
jgi:hypothetical protein